MTNLPPKGNADSMDNVAVTREEFRQDIGEFLEFSAQALGGVGGSYTTESVDPLAVVLQGTPTLAAGAEPPAADDSLRIANTRWVRTVAGVASPWQRSGTEIVPDNNGDSVRLNDGTGTETIRLSADGSATFAGVVNVGETLKAISSSVLSTSKLAIIGNANNTLNYGKYVFTPQKFWIGPDVNDANQAKIEFDVNAGDAFFLGDFRVGNSSAAPNLLITSDGAFSNATTAQNLFYRKTSTAGHNILNLRSNIGGTQAEKINFYADGSATFTGNVTAPNVTSDIRFKENLAPASSQLDDVKQLSALLKNWDWNDQAPMDEEIRSQRFLGLVAQEAEKVCPHITYEVKRIKQGKELTPAVLDDDGAVVTEAAYEELDDSYKALKHDVILMKLLGTVGELIAKNEALEAKVAALENP